MPSKFVIRKLKENAYYHIYNVGVEGKSLFLETEDYETFLFYLFIYTLPASDVKIKYPNLPERLVTKNLANDLKLVAYCLMPNHFHLFIKQQAADSMPKLLKQITNGYTTYFNTKYQKKGRLFQGRYKSTLVESEYLSIQMVRFVHLNPSEAGLCGNPRDYVWSSYNDHSPANDTLNRFGSVEEWEKFHLDRESYLKDLPKLKHLIIEN